MAIWTLLWNLFEHVGSDRSAANGTVVDQPGVDQVEQDGCQDKKDHVLVRREKNVGGAANDTDENKADLFVVHPLEFNGLLFKPEIVKKDGGDENQH